MKLKDDVWKKETDCGRRGGCRTYEMKVHSIYDDHINIHCPTCKYWEKLDLK